MLPLYGLGQQPRDASFLNLGQAQDAVCRILLCVKADLEFLLFFTHSPMCYIQRSTSFELRANSHYMHPVIDAQRGEPLSEMMEKRIEP